jgi:hypothetical protein
VSGAVACSREMLGAAAMATFFTLGGGLSSTLGLGLGLAGWDL